MRVVAAIVESHHFVVVHAVHSFEVALVMLISRPAGISLIILSLSGAIPTISPFLFKVIAMIESVISSGIFFF